MAGTKQAIGLLGALPHVDAAKLWNMMKMPVKFELTAEMDVHQLAALLNDTPKDKAVELLTQGAKSSEVTTVLRHMDPNYSTELTCKSRPPKQALEAGS